MRSAVLDSPHPIGGDAREPFDCRELKNGYATTCGARTASLECMCAVLENLEAFRRRSGVF
jgi:hypothetical protein